MHRVVIHGPGSYDRLALEQGPDLSPGPGQVVVDVTFAGVNYADCMVRMGLYKSAREFVGWPITPGFEFAGTIRAVGRGASGLQPGDPVFGVSLFNAYASQVCVRGEYLRPLPPDLAPERAAGFPAVFLTAWFALHELAHPRPGARVLVHSAAGGVGGALCQLARRAGCEVTGVVGASHKAAHVDAHHVIDKSSTDLWTRAHELAPDGWDVICDANGVATLADSYAHLRPSGKLVVYGFHTMIPRTGGRPSWPKLAVDYLRTPRFSPLRMTSDCKSVLAFNLSFLFDRTDLLGGAMDDLLGWLEAGQLRPPPAKLYELAAVGQAHADIESGQTVGKLVLRL